MSTSLGLFDKALIPGGVFDELLVKEAWFDVELFVETVVVPPIPPVVPPPKGVRLHLQGTLQVMGSNQKLAVTAVVVSKPGLASALTPKSRPSLTGPIRPVD